MKTEILKGLLILIAGSTFLTGCGTTFDAGPSMSPAFPAAPVDKYNSPDSPAVTGK